MSSGVGKATRNDKYDTSSRFTRRVSHLDRCRSCSLGDYLSHQLRFTWPYHLWFSTRRQEWQGISLASLSHSGPQQTCSSQYAGEADSCGKLHPQLLAG